ncbi:energy-coupling factor transporter ATPase [Laceyella putida]|uniref:Energy-coupling factor transporter ATP-binding protein EcfA2 n=1 Tax=Laceyella putida TaxID=110101 RepID=A0ABW2RNL5_9BACL
MEIVIEKLNVIYHPGTPFAKQALTDINLRISSGSFVALMGATGSGKSTLIQTMAGLIKPTSGRIWIGDQEMTGGSKQTAPIRRAVGIAFQYPEHQLFEETVAKDIAFGPRLQGLTEEQVVMRVEEAMRWVGLSPSLKDRSPFALSGGQMRRVAIAGILAMAPQVLILDEPTAGLDPRGQREMLEMIELLHRERGLTVILVTHQMEEAARYGEQLVILSEGRIALSGTPKEVFREAERLSQLRLDLPPITKLIARLNQQLEPPLPLTIFTVEELERELQSRWKRGEKG